MTHDLCSRLVRALRAGTRGIVLQSPEEDRALEHLEQVADELGWPLHTWTATEGVDEGGAGSLDALLTDLGRDVTPGLWVVLDGAPLLSDPASRRGLRTIAQRHSGPAVIVLDPPGSGPQMLLSSIPELVDERLPPPAMAELAERIAWATSLATEDERHPLAAHAHTLARAAVGLPRYAVDRLLAEGMLEHPDDPQALPGFIAAHKPFALDREGMLEIVRPVPEAELGGLHSLKHWLHRRALALDPRARKAAIPAPRGVLLLGVQGCGKSLAACVCADILGLPLVRLDPGRLFGGTVGESEANLRRTLALVERLAPVVLWLDEIDKGLAGVDGGASDAGTTSRVIGGLLTWLQERRQPVFVAATANRVEALPPELLRRGRLDEIFFVDLPDAQQRREVLKVHLQQVPLRRYGVVPPLADPWERFAELADTADGYSGAELEAALVAARLDAFADDRPLAANDLRLALLDCIPLSRSRAETIERLRSWAEHRARLA